jgi:CDP-glucose 4,6-dehydratase
MLTRRLLELGADVVGLVRDWIPDSPVLNPPLVERMKLVRGDLEDYSLVLRTLTEHEIDTVFHLGAQTIVRMGARSALPTFETNIKGAWNVLEACRYCSDRVDRLLIASSHRVYGPQSGNLCLTEEATSDGIEAYDVSKVCTEALARSYFHREGLPIVIPRMGNLFGPGDLNFSRLIPATVRHLLRGESPVVEPGATMIRGLLYVEDAAEACLKLIEALPQPSVVGEAFNVSDDRPVTVRQLVRLLLEIINRMDLAPPELEHEPCRPPLQRLDSTKCERAVGWRPRFTLEQGLRRTIEWYAQLLQQPASTPHPYPPLPSNSSNGSRGRSPTPVLPPR